jgi:hypothetical protein
MTAEWLVIALITNQDKDLSQKVLRISRLPMVELIEQSRSAIDELIDVLGRAHLEAVLQLSAESIAGPRHAGKKGGEIGWHGREEGTVCLRERKVRVERPRLRRKGRGRG